MAHVQPLPRDALEALARKIGERLSPAKLSAVPPGGVIEIGESFPVWSLGLDATTRSTTDLKNLAVQTGYWHHQIRHPSGEGQIARSTPTGPHPDDWQVVDVANASAAATKIDDAIEWIDQNVSGDPLVRMLVIPAYYLTAFWLEDTNGSRIVIADMSKSMEENKVLQSHHVYTAQDFLGALARERHARGVPLPPPGG